MRPWNLLGAGLVCLALLVAPLTASDASSPARPPLKGVQVDSEATQTRIRTMPFLTAEPAERGETQRVITETEESIPVNATASVVYLAGMYNSFRLARGSWAEHGEDDPDRDDQQYVGREIGSLNVVYADHTRDTIPLVFGATAWSPWFGQNYQPFASIPSARDALSASLRLHKTGAEEPTFYLALRVPDKRITDLVLIDDPGLRGRPVVTGVTLATTDEGEHLQPFFTLGVATADREATVDAEAPGDWSDNLQALSHVLNTRESDLPDSVELVDFPEGVDATRIKFLGGRDADMLSNIWVANLLGMRAKFAPDDGFFHETGLHNPWFHWGGYGGWLENFGLYYDWAYARSSGHFAGTAMRNLWNDQRRSAFVDFVDHWLYYYRDDHNPDNGPPNPGLDGYPSDIPPHWSYVLSEPNISGHDYNEIPGNEEMDGTCSTIVARWEAWRWLGRPTGAWLSAPRENAFGHSRWDSTRDAAEFIPWLMDHYERNVVYSEGETTGAAGGPTAQGHYQIYPNYTCMVALRASAEIADAQGETEPAQRWRAYADRIEAAMPDELTEGDPFGRVWRDSPTSIFPAQAHTLAPAWYAPHYSGLDPREWNSPLIDVTRNTFQREINRHNGLVRVSGFGYGQGWLTQSALALDEMDSAAPLLRNIAHYSYDKNTRLKDEWSKWQWIIPESTVVLPDGSWHRAGDLGNGANQGEAVRALEVAAGVDDSDPSVLKLLPRVPEPLDGIEVTDARAMVRSGEATVPARISYRFEKDGTFSFTSDRVIPNLAVRMGPFASKADAERAIGRGRFPKGASTEVVRAGHVAGGDAFWVWVEDLRDVSTVTFRFRAPMPRVTGALTAGSEPVTAGEVEQVDATVRNNSRKPISDVHITLAGPSGWEIEPKGSSRLRVLRPDNEFDVRFDVTVPPTQEVDDRVVLTGTLSYRRLGGQTVTVPLETTVAVRSPVSFVSFTAGSEVVQPGEQTTLTAVVGNDASTGRSARVEVQVPDGWSVDTPTRDVELPPGTESTVEFTATNTSSTGRTVTFDAQVTQGTTIRDEAQAAVFTGRLRCLLGHPTREEYHHDTGLGCVLDQGRRFDDIPPFHWPEDAVVRHQWEHPSAVLFHIDVPEGTTGTLRLFIADPDTFVGGRRATISVEDVELGTFGDYERGRWVEAVITTEDTSDGRIDVEVTNARQGSNVGISIVEL